MAMIEARVAKGVNEMAKVRLNKRSGLTLPKEVVDALHLQEGDEMEVKVDQGRIVLEPVNSQGWYWSEQWQQEEREADADLQAGRLSEPVSSVDELQNYLDRLKG
ncbi:MAG TPA: AbrB/MazE/SpoVT family DNA-binding domain-containing protein [Bacilli bacterium]|nr:AbrB/MazE/SpoVT family DNA-binding domain-containing protein [Bacilli bacterium]